MIVLGEEKDGWRDPVEGGGRGAEGWMNVTFGSGEPMEKKLKMHGASFGLGMELRARTTSEILKP